AAVPASAGYGLTFSPPLTTLQLAEHRSEGKAVKPKEKEKERSQAETRQRLLEAAGELFAEKGFRLAGTREICRKAGTDIAAIHYHFGNKENLYEAVLRYADSLLV